MSRIAKSEVHDALAVTYIECYHFPRRALKEVFE